MTFVQRFLADRRTSAARASQVCAGCREFSVIPLQIEAQLPGLSALSSAFASVRGSDGLCIRHQRLLASDSSCADYRPIAGR